MTAHAPIAAQILAFISANDLPTGTHLPAQVLAQQLRVSRSPINEALRQLHEGGLLTHERNRGYFVGAPVHTPAADVAAALGLPQHDVVTDAYFRIADDLLRGRLATSITESLLRSRYDLTAVQLNAVLGRIATEGWIERKPGYGWEFSRMMRTPETLMQSYRLRLALEPAALLEPGYRLDAAVLVRCRLAEERLLAGGIETASAQQLHDRGVLFHESLVEASGNPFFIDTIRRVNRVRRLLSYRSTQHRARYRQHCEQHLAILALLAQADQVAASQALAAHLQCTIDNLGDIDAVLRATDAGRLPPS